MIIFFSQFFYLVYYFWSLSENRIIFRYFLYFPFSYSASGSLIPYQFASFCGRRSSESPNLWLSLARSLVLDREKVLSVLSCSCTEWNLANYIWSNSFCTSNLRRNLRDHLRSWSCCGTCLSSLFYLISWSCLRSLFQVFCWLAFNYLPCWRLRTVF